MNKKRLLVTFCTLLILCVILLVGCSSSGETYTLTYKVLDQTYKTETVSGKQKIKMPNSPKVNGYAFDGWYLDKDYETVFTEYYLVNIDLKSDFSVFAKFSPVKYSINYEIGYGETDNPLSYTIEDTIELKEPFKAGYLFKGWYSDANLENKVEKIEEGTFGNLTLYSDWELDSNAYGKLPLIEINTQNSQLPFDKETYINCSFSISNCKNTNYNFSVDMKNEYGDSDSVGIRLRGNSTLGYPKKPYRIKFDKKKSLFGLEKNKSWVLLADYLDTSNIRNYSAFTLGAEMENLDFTATPNHVVLYLNGVYKGLYLLTEQMDEKEGRANVESDIDPTTQTDFPFLVEMDRHALSDGVTGVDNFKTDYYSPFVVKYPEYEDRNIAEGQTDVVFNYIKEYLTAVFETLKTGGKVDVSFRNSAVGFEDLVDVDSFLEFYLVNEILCNRDSTWGSVYMHKTADGKMMFGPLWDFDWSLAGEFPSEPYEYSQVEYSRWNIFLLPEIGFQSPLKDYIQTRENFAKLCVKWNNIKDKILEVVDKLYSYKKVISAQAKYDANFWYGERGDVIFDLQYDGVRLFILERYDYLDSLIVESNYETFLYE